MNPETYEEEYSKWIKENRGDLIEEFLQHHETEWGDYQQDAFIEHIEEAELQREVEKWKL